MRSGMARLVLVSLVTMTACGGNDPVLTAPHDDAASVEATAMVADAPPSPADAPAFVRPEEAGVDVVDAARAPDAVAPDAVAPDAVALDAVAPDAVALDVRAVDVRAVDPASVDASERGRDRPPAVDDLVLYMAANGSSDANDGRSPMTAVRSLGRIHAILEELRPTGDVRVLVRAGTYACREMQEPWTFRGARSISLEPLGTVPGPASASADHPSRPVFVGMRENGELCPTSVWLSIAHGGAAMHLTLRGLAVERYRGAISINAPGATVTASQDITLDNMVFAELGDRYHRFVRPNGMVLYGKGAILLTNTRGNRITNSLFREIRNGPEYPGIVHGLYLTSLAANNLIEDNVFQGCSGSWIKLTDYSNHNVIRGNRFSDAPDAVVDRWCGAFGEEPARCDGGFIDCPSWENEFFLSRNTIAGSVRDPVTVYRIPPGQTCRFPRPASGVRMRLGPSQAVTGSFP